MKNLKNKNYSEVDGYMNKRLNSSGFNKMNNYFLSLLERNDFLKDILEAQKIDLDDYKKVSKETFRICNKYFIPFDSSYEIIQKLIYSKNKKEFDSFLEYVKKSGLINVGCDSVCYISMASGDQELYTDDKELMEHDFIMYPIVLKISLFASKRDILDCIEREYSFAISGYQKKIKKENNINVSSFLPGGVRKKKNKERDDFIYKKDKEGKKIKEICKLLSEEMDIILDEGHVSKIISIEKNRRKEV